MKWINKVIKFSFISILVILLVFSMITPVGATNSSNEQDDPQMMVAKLYAEHYRVSLDEALIRLQLQGKFPDLEQTIFKQDGGTFGGLWIQHEPEYKIVVAFTNKHTDTIEKYKDFIPEEVIPFIQEKIVKKTLITLLQEQENIYGTLIKSGININSRIDVMNNCVSIDVKTTNAKNFTGTLHNLFPLEADTIQVNYVDELAQLATNIYGGLTSQYPDYSDYNTYAFAVKTSTGTKGIVTCGHGSSTLYYNHISLPLVGSAIYDLYWDCQWHTCPGLIVTNKIQTTGGGGTMDITSVVPRYSQSVGAYVMKYGRTTGLTAGMISSKTANYFGCPTWMEVSNTLGYPNLLLPGDSGGPWFTVANNAAYGITSAGANNWQLAIYMAIDYISVLGVGVMTSP